MNLVQLGLAALFCPLACLLLLNLRMWILARSARTINIVSGAAVLTNIVLIVHHCGLLESFMNKDQICNDATSPTAKYNSM